MKRRKRKI